jgi:beta-phosphoglucomutase-like phosphatase (HAD superfamily)
MTCRTHKHHFAVNVQNHQETVSLMHHVVTGDDPEVTAGKPCPDIFLAAMRRFEVMELTVHGNGTTLSPMFI